MSVQIIRKSEDYIVCKNIKHFCAYRGYTMLNYVKPTEQDVKTMVKFEVMCEKNDKKIRIIYVPRGSKFAKHQELTSLMSDGIQTIVIKSSLIKKINIGMVNSEAPISLIEARCLLTNYAKFLEVHGYRAEIVPEVEVNRLLNLYKIPHKKCLSQICVSAIEVVWLDAKLDDIIHIEYPTIASCEVSSNYKIVSEYSAFVDEEESFELD